MAVYSRLSGVTPGISKRFFSSVTSHGEYDLCVVGGGILGVATAREIARRHRSIKVAVLEAESGLARHQSGHNSGVIHAGIYYTPGTTQARCCVEGMRQMYVFCKEKKIPHEKVGKLIVATDESEAPVIDELLERGQQNGLDDLSIVDAEGIRILEPNVAGVRALVSPSTGIVDYAVVTNAMADDLREAGGDVHVNFRVDEFSREAGVVRMKGKEKGQKGPTKSVTASYVIACCGTRSDEMAKLMGGRKAPAMVPFRGNYLQLKSRYTDLVHRNIYPIPNTGGIPVGSHLTPTLNAERGRGLIVGPGACLAFSKDGYRFWDMELGHLANLMTNWGFLKFVMKHFGLSLEEVYKNFNRRAMLKEVQKLVPSIAPHMVEDSFSGVMAQAFASDGTTETDFIFEELPNILLLRSAPSPACTASISLAEDIANRAEKQMK